MYNFLALLWGVSAAFAQETSGGPPSTSGGQTFPGLMNPSISANGLFLASLEADDGTLAPPSFSGEGGELAGKGETFGTGLSVQEMEIQLLSVVDPYFKANLVLAIPGTEGIEVEEGYVTLTSLPQVLVNVGKIKAPFGRENLTHTHALLTIDRALISQRVFGEEGLNDVGVHVAWMMPLPWYSEVTVGVDAGSNEVVLGSAQPEGVGGLAHWKNVVDLSPTYTVELGVSGLVGENAALGVSKVGGVDLTIKGRGRSRHQWNRLVWQNELIVADLGCPSEGSGGCEAAQIGGLYSTLTGSFSRRFWLGGRFDLVGLPAPVDGGQTLGASAIAVFAPTEFSGMRLQAQRQFLPDGHTADSLVGQLIFTIGGHPAHSY